MNCKPIVALVLCYCVFVLVAGITGTALMPQTAAADGMPNDPPAKDTAGDTIFPSPPLIGTSTAVAQDDSPGMAAKTTAIARMIVIARSLFHWKWI